jgi:hypothetical protein
MHGELNLQLPRTTGNGEARNVATSEPRLEDMVSNLVDDQALRRLTEEVF